MHSNAQKWLFVAAALFVLASVAFGAVLFRSCSDPAVPLLIQHGKAKWILHDEPTDIVAKSPGDVFTGFRKVFTADAAHADATLTVYAMKNAAVFIDGNLINAPFYDFNDWKKPLKLGIGRLISPGKHEIKIDVLNKTGPAALLAYCEPLGLFTGPDWQASLDKVNWSAARDAERMNPPRISTMFPRSDRTLASILAYIVPVFFVVFAWTLAVERYGAKRLGRAAPGASAVRWVVLVAWVALAANNIWKLQPDAGFDIEAHLQYIAYVAENWRIPLPTEGWQMFQSPLYYIVSAPVYLFFKQFSGTEAVTKALRAVPLFCGIAEVELTYRALKRVFPGREDLQALGTVVGGLLPMNIYISQYAGNEPMAGLFTSAALLVMFGIITGPFQARPGKTALLGLFFGLALLSKVTPVLLAPPLIFMLAYSLHEKGARPGRVCSLVALFLVTALLVSGWYYARNWIEIGSPFVGGWDASRGISWWQDPGYRTAGQFFTFGRSLLYPIYSSYTGFWDAFYSTLWLDGYLSALNDFVWRPAWNYDFLISSALLSLIPSAGIVAGAVSTLFHPERSLRNGELFALSCVAVYLAALMYLFLKVPIYSTVKASYTLGLIPCYAVLSVAGFRTVLNSGVVRALVYGCVAAWAVSVYIAYFIL